MQLTVCFLFSVSEVISESSSYMHSSIFVMLQVVEVGRVAADSIAFLCWECVNACTEEFPRVYVSSCFFAMQLLCGDSCSFGKEH